MVLLYEGWESFYTGKLRNQKNSSETDREGVISSVKFNTGSFTSKVCSDLDYVRRV